MVFLNSYVLKVQWLIYVSEISKRLKHELGSNSPRATFRKSERELLHLISTTLRNEAEKCIFHRWAGCAALSGVFYWLIIQYSKLKIVERVGF